MQTDEYGAFPPPYVGRINDKHLKMFSFVWEMSALMRMRYIIFECIRLFKKSPNIQFWNIRKTQFFDYSNLNIQIRMNIIRIIWT